jgi:predicted porin
MMKKTLISTAAMLAMAGSANAQVAVYGLIDLCYGKSLYSDLNSVKADVHSGGDNGSSECNSTTRVGFKGAYEVAKGVKVNFKLESGGITSDGHVNYDEIAVANGQAASGVSGPFFRRAA